jgi:hypothetical protein
MQKGSGLRYFNHAPWQGHGAALFSMIDDRGKIQNPTPLATERNAG